MVEVTKNQTYTLIFDSIEIEEFHLIMKFL